jgi:hypothetical protein
MGRVSWKIAGASVVGFSHETAGVPCQDAHATSVLPGGWFVGAVCDGAGTAARSAEGARLVADGVVAHISSRLNAFQSRNQLTETLAKEWVQGAVEEVRAQLSSLAEGQSIRIAEFHATLVGAIAGPSGGIFFHVGDGAALATTSSDFSESVVSHPENGEYANETYFVTQEEWQQHLRTVTFGPKFNLITLMSDGVTPFALAPEASGASVPFFDPLSRYLTVHERQESERELAALLRRDAIRRVTGDDKTLLWALRIT